VVNGNYSSRRVITEQNRISVSCDLFKDRSQAIYLFLQINAALAATHRG
jgi:hypothetical protein